MQISPGEISFAIYRRLARDDAGEFSLNGQLLCVLMEMDGKKTVPEIAESCGLNMDLMGRAISKLLQLELIETVEKAVLTLDGEFFDYLNIQLSLAIGPLADIIIEEAVIDMGHSLSSFPAPLAMELVDLISREIQREEKRIIFKDNLRNKISDNGY
jgi:predicted transcriptional regulator